MTRALILLLILAAAPMGGAADGNPATPASKARFDLIASEAMGSLTQGKLIEGLGTVEREAWKPEDEQPRGYVVRAEVTPYAWNKITFQFLPQRSGEIRIELKGPWVETLPGSGTLAKKEILWDTIGVDGNTITPDWSGGWVEGEQKKLCTWHDAPASTTIEVEGGKPVSITVSARPRIPAGFEMMPRIQARDTAAHQAAERFRRGINISNYLEMPPGAKLARYSEADFVAIEREGFDHVRIPVAWHHGAGAGPAFEIDQKYFDQADALIGWARRHRLAVVLDWHHFDQFSEDPMNESHTAQLVAGWEQIAQHYRDSSRSLVFELLNEPNGAATTEILNDLYPKLISKIRESNPERTLVLGPGDFNGIGELDRFRLPPGDHNLIVAVHFYDPYIFSHQGASWLPALASLSGIQFPGPPAEPLRHQADGWIETFLAAYNSAPAESNPCGPNAIAAKLRIVGHWSDYFGRPVHVGEFGCYQAADPQSRVNYCGTVRRAIESAGLGWAMWEWKSGFHYSRDGRPDPPGMREALFGDRR